MDEEEEEDRFELTEGQMDVWKHKWGVEVESPHRYTCGLHDDSYYILCLCPICVSAGSERIRMCCICVGLLPLYFFAVGCVTCGKCSDRIKSFKLCCTECYCPCWFCSTMLCKRWYKEPLESYKHNLKCSWKESIVSMREAERRVLAAKMQEVHLREELLSEKRAIRRSWHEVCAGGGGEASSSSQYCEDTESMDLFLTTGDLDQALSRKQTMAAMLMRAQRQVQQPPSLEEPSSEDPQGSNPKSFATLHVPEEEGGV